MTEPTTKRSSGRAVVLIVGLGALLALVVALTGSGVTRPYDLDDSGDSGYKALGLILGRLGTHIDTVDARDVGPSLATTTPVVFVPVADGAGPSVLGRWRAYVRAGGTLVVGTPLPTSGVKRSPHTEPGFLSIVAQPTEVCHIAALRGLRSVFPNDTEPLLVPSGASSCYGSDRFALVVQQSVGAGSIVTLGSPELFTNEAMRPHNEEVDDPPEPMRDNVVVAQRLLAPDGSSRLAVVTSGVDAAPSSGHDKAVTDFLSPGVKIGLWELLAAAIVYLLWRARRHGRVIVEPQPVPIAGSELVAAVGNLMSRRGDPGRAASAVRHDTMRAISQRLGVPPSTDPRLLAAMIAQRAGVDEVAVIGALYSTPVTTDADLVAVTRQLETIRQETLHGRQPTAASAPAGPAAVSGAPTGAVVGGTTGPT